MKPPTIQTPRRGLPRISIVVGARPNFVKVAPLLRALTGEAEMELVHTGQHYDDRMSAVFFRDLGIREPDLNLDVGAGSHAEQTGDVLLKYERLLAANPPEAVLVVGDVNSTLAAALAAAKLNIRVAHVEAGLRSNDWSMPEEVNRVLTDRLSTWLFTYSEDADANLLREGIAADAIHLVGNVMIDTLLTALPSARARFDAIKTRLELPDEYGVLTLHRPANLEALRLEPIIEAVREIASSLPLVFPAHPRTSKAIPLLLPRNSDGISVIEPLGYLDFVALLDRASLTLTDSGGLQEETSVLGVPCVTLRNSTERPITITRGTNILGGIEKDDILAATAEILAREVEPARIPFWDGKAAERIAEILLRSLK